MNVLLLVDMVRAPLTGIGRYVYELAGHLPRVAAVERACYYDWADGFVSPLALRARAMTTPLSATRRLTRARCYAHRMAAGVARRIGLPEPAFRRTRAPSRENLVCHGPAFALPPGSGPRVVTIADLSVLTHPEFHPALRVKMLSRDIYASIRQADRLITFSQFTRNELVARMGVDPTRVHAVPLAADSAFMPRCADAVAPVLARYGLTWGGYCLSVGTIEPRKRVDSMLDAFERLEPALKNRYPLALIGDRGWLSDATHRRISALARQGQVRYLGYLPQQELPLVYSGAAACLYTSLYEGFGLPAVEAMASGVPLVTMRAASLPEVCGDGAILVTPDDIDAFSGAITRVLTDHACAMRLAQRGRAIATQYGWERTARETVSVYQQALGL
ncbi:glycosyltransferase family 4 protein [Immundisolibacter sp.]